MNKTMVARLLTLGAVVSTIVGFGTVGYNTETGANLASKIAELKQLAITWKNNSTAKDELISQKEQELSVLQDKYNSILTLLGISDMNANEDTIKEAINSLSSEQDLKDIATALGISDTASKEDILNEISVMGETMTTLKDSIDTLESTVGQLTAEIERLQGEVNKANTAESEMLAEVATALNDIGMPVEEEGPTVEEGPALEELKASMDSAWITFEAEANDNNFYKTADVKNGNYTLNEAENKILVGGKNQVVDEEFITALKAYEQAKADYINAGGTLE